MDLRQAQKRVYQNKVDEGFNITDVNKERECKVIDGVLKHVSQR